MKKKKVMVLSLVILLILIIGIILVFYKNVLCISAIEAEKHSKKQKGRNVTTQVKILLYHSIFPTQN